MTDRYSYSSLQDFKACPLRYKLRRIDGLELRDAAVNTHHLVFGSAMHAGLEHIYALKRDGHNDPAGLMYAQEIFKSLYPVQLDPLDRAKTQENGIRALALYVERWKEEDKKWKVLEVESLDTGDSFDSGLGALRLDLVAENLEHGGIYGWDHKITGSVLGYRYWDRYNPHSQITHYIDHIQQKYGSCEGFIINAVSMQWRDERKSNNASNVALFELSDPAQPWLAYSQYEQRFIKGNKSREMIAAWGLTVGFERAVFNRSQDQIEQERRSTTYWIRKIEQSFGVPDVLGANNYGFNTDACYSCQYRGGDVVGGICRPGYEWPRDTELILLSYRQVCRQIIKLACPACAGSGIDAQWREQLGRDILDGKILFITDYDKKEWRIDLKMCVRCNATGEVDGPRCALDRGHAGECAPTLPPEQISEGMVEVEVTI